MQQKDAQARLADCEYLGTRIEGGFGSTTVHRYDCGGTVFETRVPPR